MKMKIESKPQSVNKFYFLEYFYVLLKSIESYSNQDNVFDSFKNLKQEHQLGESKYKKLTFEKEELSKTQVDRYRYTFEQVIGEAEAYGLIHKKKEELLLSEKGHKALIVYQEKGLLEFNRYLLPLMENKYHAFYYLINFFYRANKKKGGLLIFPNYSPLKLHFERADIKTTVDIEHYSSVLVKKMEEEIAEYIGEKRDLEKQHNTLMERLIKTGLLPSEKNERFVPKKYNSIIKRFRDFWLNYFLKDIYGYQYSLNSFDIWIYRGKQIGIMHATEFYPNSNGRIVYPTSIIIDFKASKDFNKIFEYNNGYSLFIHHPSWDNEQTQEEFVKSLTNAYFDVRKTSRSYFVSLADVREIVCYNMKIPEYLFDDFLKKAYRLNLTKQLNIHFSLEADKLPQETNAIYIKREPVMIDDRYRNIIAIDITRGDRKHGKIIEKTE